MTANASATQWPIKAASSQTESEWSCVEAAPTSEFDFWVRTLHGDEPFSVVVRSSYSGHFETD